MSGVNWTADEIARLDVVRHLDSTQPLRAKAISPAVKASGRIRVPKGMNKTEARYAQHLEAQKAAGAVVAHAFEDVTLRIGKDCRYTPDFMVVMPHIEARVQFHEVKGRRKGGGAYYEDDARVKIAAAAKQYPMFKFLMVWPAANGEWESKEF